MRRNIISLRKHPAYLSHAIAYFQDKWATPESRIMYEDCLTRCIGAVEPLVKIWRCGSFLPLLLLLLSLAGCAGRAQQEPVTMPPLLDDPSFVQDMRMSRTMVSATGHTEKMKRIVAVAPSSGVKEDAEPTLRAMAGKLDVVIPSRTFSREAVPYNANSDDVRLNALVDALADPDIAVVWAVRGGYGASRLLERLARMPVSLFSKKIVIGYSDITFLHLFLQKLGWQTVHGAMFAELANSAKDENNFRALARLLAGKVPVLQYEGLTPCNAAAKALARPVRGVIVGGNLACLVAATGTPWEVDAAGKILFLEEVQEPGYKLDRMLTQLKDAGQLDGVQAIILGEFSAGDTFTTFALERFAKDCPIPIFETKLFGHGPTNLPLLLNAPAVLGEKLHGSDAVKLTIQTDALVLPK